MKLPKLPDSVDGQIDMMIGIKYLRYHPKLIFQAKSGLSIYQSRFHSINGARGILGGPHHLFHGQSTQTNHFSKEYKSIKSHSHLSSEVSMCGFKDSVQEFSYFDEIRPSVFSSSPLKSFNQIEEVGSEITYCCTTCRDARSAKTTIRMKLSVSEKKQSKPSSILLWQRQSYPSSTTHTQNLHQTR